MTVAKRTTLPVFSGTPEPLFLIAGGVVFQVGRLGTMHPLPLSGLDAG